MMARVANQVVALTRRAAICLYIAAVLSRQVFGQEAPQPASSSFFDYTWFVNVISQTLTRFPSPYKGVNSLLSRDETEVTTYYSISGTFHFLSHLEGNITYQAAYGNGVGGNAVGIAGYSNGDVIRVPIGGLSKAPYFARYYLQWTEPLARGGQFFLLAGKMAAPDLFDTNPYANGSGRQFLNWALINNAAWDFDADTQGYTKGIALEWIYPAWAFRIGSFQMPTFANGPLLSDDFAHSRGDQMELELHPHLLGSSRNPAIMKLLLYQNHADMGSYQEALNQAVVLGKVPDITSVRKRGSLKYGFGFNFAQPLADQGNTGLFARYGWNDGHTESFAFTEVDRTASLGFQLAGSRWRIPSDRWGIAMVQNDLSAVHRDYLAAGGLGFQLGDGKLNYGSERIVETYYSHLLSSLATISFDYQRIVNPGYNRDRGPVSIYSLRMRFEP